SAVLPVFFTVRVRVTLSSFALSLKTRVCLPASSWPEKVPRPAGLPSIEMSATGSTEISVGGGGSSATAPASGAGAAPASAAATATAASANSTAASTAATIFGGGGDGGG